MQVWGAVGRSEHLASIVPNAVKEQQSLLPSLLAKGNGNLLAEPTAPEQAQRTPGTPWLSKSMSTLCHINGAVAVWAAV